MAVPFRKDNRNWLVSEILSAFRVCHASNRLQLGSLRLYRAPGSVAFLSCGSVLQPIFPKSQCWCMEEDGSKFILQIRPPSYWRIELAAQSAHTQNGDDAGLRRCLESVLLLDKTPCPFKESVPISLPTESLSVKKRQAWKPLRSYPSEPILCRKSGEVSGDGNVVNESWKGGAITEHEMVREELQEERSNYDPSSNKVTTDSGSAPRETTRPNSLDVEPRANSTPAGEGRPSAVEEGSLSKDLITAERPTFAENKVVVVSTAAQADCQAALDSVEVVTANQTVIPLEGISGQLPEKLPAGTDEKKDIRRRYTIDSSWCAEMDSIVQTTSSMPPKGPSRLEDADAQNAGLQEDVAAKRKTLTIQQRPSPASEDNNIMSKAVSQIRLRRAEPIDDGPVSGSVRGEEDRRARRLEIEPASSDMLSKTMLLLFYAVFGMIVLALRTAATTMVSWRKPSNEAAEDDKSPQRTSRTRTRKLQSSVADDNDK